MYTLKLMCTVLERKNNTTAQIKAFRTMVGREGGGRRGQEYIDENKSENSLNFTNNASCEFLDFHKKTTTWVGKVCSTQLWR